MSQVTLTFIEQAQRMHSITRVSALSSPLSDTQEGGAEARNGVAERAYRRCMLASAYSCGDKSFSDDCQWSFGVRKV